MEKTRKEYPVYEIEHKEIWGRTVKDGEALLVFYNASGLELNVKAEELFVTMEAEYDTYELWADILIEGELSQRFALQEGIHTYPVFRGLDGKKPVNVRIFRDTQAMSDDTKSVFRILDLRTDGEFLPVKGHPYSIEVIGDSITSGEACGVTKREEWVSLVFDAVHSYPYLLGELLDAKIQVFSQSGWGLVASWDGDELHSMPGYYHQICGMMTHCDYCKNAGAQEAWDFGKFQPDAVIINLGTNDGSAMVLYEKEQEEDGLKKKWTPEEYLDMFHEAAVHFLKNVREKNPGSKIIWAYGILGNVMETYIKEAVEAYKKETGDERVFYLSLPDCGDRKGVREHPDREAHREAARVLAEFLNKKE